MPAVGPRRLWTPAKPTLTGNAIDGLKKARAAYLAAARPAEWSAYRAPLMGTHGRKYKLVGMLKQRDDLT